MSYFEVKVLRNIWMARQLNKPNCKVEQRRSCIAQAHAHIC